MSLRIASASIVLLACVSLAACAAPPADSNPSPTATSTPSASPTPEPQGAPRSILPLACADLFSDSAASELTGAPVQAVADPDLVSNTYAIAARQGGELACSWSAGGQPEPYYGSPLTLSIIDDSEQQFSPGQDPECYASASDSGCRTSVLVDGYWLGMRLASRTAGTDSGVTLESLTAKWVAAKNSVTAAIQASGAARAAWVAPAGSLAGAFCDSREPFPTYPASWPAQVAAARVEKGCVTDDGWSVSIVPGGSWALPGMAQALPPADKEVGSWTPFDVAGADIALRACGEYCIAIVSVGGSAVSVSSGTYMDAQVDGVDVVQFDDAARGMLAQVIAAG